MIRLESGGDLIKRRPVVIVTLTLVILIVILQLLGVPLKPVSRDQSYAELLFEQGGEYIVQGKVTEVKCYSQDAASETGQYVAEREGYTVWTMKNAAVSIRGENLKIGGVRITLKGLQRVGVGTRVWLQGAAEKIRGAENPGQFDTAAYLRNKGIGYQMKYPEIVSLDESAAGVMDRLLGCLQSARNRAAKQILRVFPGDDGGILCAMLIGSRDALSDDSRSLWQSGGIMHMMAISGLHLSLLGLGFFSLLRKLRVRLVPAGMTAILFMAGYTVFTGMAVSTVRAFGMCVVMISARVTGRTYDPPTAIAFSAALILIENPGYLFYSGFQLSFAAVVITCAFRKRGRGMTCVMLYLGMLPLLLGTSSEFPLYSIAVNAVAVPLLPALLAAGIGGTVIGSAVSVIGASALPFAGAVCAAAAFPAKFLLEGFNTLLKMAAALPFSTLILGKPSAARVLLYYAVLGGWSFGMKKLRLWKRRLFLYLLLPFMILLLSFRPRTGLKLFFLSVGQGDSMVIEAPNGMNLMIDSGSTSISEVWQYRVEPFVKSEGIRQLDYVFVTHMDSDHTNGIEALLQDILSHKTQIGIGTIVLPALAQEDDAYTNFTELARTAGVRLLYAAEGDCFAFGHILMEVLNPDAGRTVNGESGKNMGAVQDSDADSNAECLVLTLHFGNFDALFTGDVTGAGEENIMQQLKKYRCGWEVLKVAHHGSKYSTPEEFLTIVKPEVSVISVGKNSRYGHPHQQLLTRLKNAGSRIFRTDEAGMITVTSDGNRYQVETYLDAA